MKGHPRNTIRAKERSEEESCQAVERLVKDRIESLVTPRKTKGEKNGRKRRKTRIQRRKRSIKNREEKEGEREKKPIVNK